MRALKFADLNYCPFCGSKLKYEELVIRKNNGVVDYYKDVGYCFTCFHVFETVSSNEINKRDKEVYEGTAEYYVDFKKLTKKAFIERLDTDSKDQYHKNETIRMQFDNMKKANKMDNNTKLEIGYKTLMFTLMKSMDTKNLTPQKAEKIFVEIWDKIIEELPCDFFVFLCNANTSRYEFRDFVRELTNDICSHIKSTNKDE